MATDTDYAWAAGIIDGEGAICMTRCLPGINRRKTLSFQVRISVRMTHPPTIKRLHRLFGGTFKISKSRYPLRHKAAYEWYAGDLLTVTVINLVLPYLLTKLAQAKLVLRYRRECANPDIRLRCSAALTTKRRRYFEKLR